MKLGITGASGHYGRQAARGLIDRHPAADLVLISRSPSKLSEFKDQGCDVRQGDFDDQASMEAALTGVDRLLMISTGRVGSRIPQHERAIRAANAAGVKHIVYTSFVGVDDPDNPALVVTDHRGTEKLLRESGMAWTMLRDSQYADSLIQAAAPMAIGSGEWSAATGEGRIALVTRDDCVASAIAVMTGEGHENRVYNITGPDRLRFRDVAVIFAAISGRPIAFTDISSEQLYAIFDGLGIPRSAIDDHTVHGHDWSSDDMVSFEDAIRGGHFDVISDDVAQLLGRPPESFEQFAEQHRPALRAMTGDNV